MTDTTVTIDGAILGKADSPDEAATMLRVLSGRVHQVMTGFAIVGDGVHHRGVVTSDVEMVAFDPCASTSRAASGAARPARMRSRWDPGAGARACGARIGDERDRVAAGRGARGAASGRRAVGEFRRGDTGVTIADRWREVRARVDAACARAGRSPADVTIVAGVGAPSGVGGRSKRPPPRCDGFRRELRVQVRRDKRADCGDVRWHFIGRLQSNKAKLVAGQVALIHAVDSASLATELGKRAAAPQPVLIAVNLAKARRPKVA